MKIAEHIVCLLLPLFLAAACEKPQDVRPDDPIEEGVTVYGYVTSNGSGIPGVVVSDGVVTAVTGDKGLYFLKSSKSTTAVFVSTPSGYEPPSSGILLLFFKRYSRNPADLERMDFDLNPVDQKDFRLLAFGDIHLADRSFCNDLGQFRRFAREVNELAETSDVPVYAVTLGG